MMIWNLKFLIFVFI